MEQPFEREVEVTRRAVAAACRLCMAVREGVPESQVKADRSPVTVADFGAQALVSLLLAREFPDDPLVGEEDASGLETPEGEPIRRQVLESLRRAGRDESEPEILAAIRRGGFQGGRSGRFWALDPIDGTKGFLRNEQYAVALALLLDGTPVVAGLGCPNLRMGDRGGVVFLAARGRGAWQEGLNGSGATPIRVCDTAAGERARFCESVESGHSSHSRSAEVMRLLAVEQPPLRMDSQAKYGAVARGDAQAYLRLPTRAGYEERIWDHAAGALIVTEAGGVLSDVEGRPLDFGRGRTLAANRGVVASVPGLHDAILEALNATE